MGTAATERPPEKDQGINASQAHWGVKGNGFLRREDV